MTPHGVPAPKTNDAATNAATTENLMFNFVTQFLGGSATPAVQAAAPAPATASRFQACLDFTWRPDMDGQPLHVTPGDHGGATSWGVTLASYASWRADHGEHTTTEADLAAASKTELAEMIRARYWMPVGGDGLAAGVDLLAFDFGFTSGTGTSSRLLQEVLGVTVDGAIGPHTLAAAAAHDRMDLVRQLGARHQAYYQSLAQYPVFGRGWSRRNAARLAIALAT